MQKLSNEDFCFVEESEQWNINELNKIINHFKNHGLTNLNILVHELNKNKKNRNEKQIKTLFYTVNINIRMKISFN